jgi:hypothetical protein
MREMCRYSQLDLTMSSPETMTNKKCHQKKPDTQREQDDRETYQTRKLSYRLTELSE